VVEVAVLVVVEDFHHLETLAVQLNQTMLGVVERRRQILEKVQSLVVVLGHLLQATP
jgi:hypothetical protein